MARKFIITYTDGRPADEAAMTMRAMCKAEQIMAREGMTATNDSINATMRALHCSLRFSGKTQQPYDEWLDSVDDVEAVTPEADAEAGPVD